MFSKFLPILFTIFIVIDPFGLVPMYIGLTTNLDARKKSVIIRKAVITAFIVLSLFILAGKWILGFLHIHPGSFFIAGGIMLFIVSLDMLFGKSSRSKVTKNEIPPEEDIDEGTSVAVFPLAIPMMAGPGAITTIILFTSTGEQPVPVLFMLFLAVTIVLILTAVIFRASDLIFRVLGRTGVSVVERIMGMLLSGLSVQFIYDGLVKLGLFSGMGS